ncbi:MAG: UvrD-helicase domain-containing protein [Synergistaceae bacterium]|nr:UvrD-helicase domain-containing protein [Synergistaceae bacterium]
MTFTLPPGTPKGQAEAITANYPTITVEAGAGTGKTWVLTERYLRLLQEDDTLLPRDILTLTYTEAAAAEMKSRITSRIEEALDDFETPERRKAILDGLADLWISTIHSFAARYIRESGLNLDIDPAASVITQQQEDDFWDDIKNAAEFGRFREMATHYGNAELQKAAAFLDGDKDFAAAVAKWKSDKLAEFAKKTADLHASSGRTWQEMLGWAEDNGMINTTQPKVFDILSEEWHDVATYWAGLVLGTATPGTPGDNLNNLIAALNAGTVSEHDFYMEIRDGKSVSSARNVSPVINMSLSTWRGTRSSRILAATKSFGDAMTDEELRMRKTLLTFCALSWGMWDIMKRKRGLLSFSDMINHAREAISTGGIKRKFRHILVDEFQDTDPLQYKMITSLQLEDTSLFAVGDPKQSIYRFRHADPSLFAETIKESNRAVKLDTSFRTRSGLLAEINALFSAIWINGLGKSPLMSSLSYSMLNHVSRAYGDMPTFTLILAEDTRDTLEESRKNLADELAKEIYGWVHNKFTVWDKKARIVREVKYSDFAILTPSRSVFPILEEALSRFGIKSIRDKSTGFFTRGEISDVVCLMRAASGMNDDFAVAGWLMSPFSGVSEEDAVACLTLADEDTRPIELIRTRLPEAYSRLEYYALVGEVEGAAGLLALFDRDRSWLSCYPEDERMRVLRNVRLAVNIARDFQRTGTASLNACASWLTRSVSSEADYEEPAWHDDNEDAVRLGSVHSAKGLEYPVAVVFDQRVRKRPDNDSLRPSRELGLVFTDYPDEVKDGKDIKPKLVAWESVLSEQGEDEEQTRLFYVAATRAQDSLVFCGLIDAKTETPHRHTWTKLLKDHTDDGIQAIPADGLEDWEIPAKNQEGNGEAPRPVNTVKAVTPLRQISASSFSLFEWCPFAWRRSYRQGLSLSWESPSEKAEDYDDGYVGGAELGSLAHWVLARWPKGDDFAAQLQHLLYDQEALTQIPASLRGVWRNGDKKALGEWLMKFAESPLGITVRTQNVERERSFRLRLNDSTALAGAIDAVWGDSIADYKITSIDNTPPGLYESQLDFYAFVRHLQTGAECVNTSIAFLREGEVKERAITGFEGIRARIEGAAEICGSGPYTPNHGHCGMCPFKKGCVKCNAGA